MPATTFLEHTDLYFAYGHYHLQLARPAIAPVGEALPNVELFRRLAKRMGFTDACFDDSEDDMIRTLLDSDHPWVQGITLEQLDREHSLRLRVSENGKPFLPFAEGGYETPSGKCELTPAPSYEPPIESRLGDAGLRKRFPLELVSPKSADLVNSTFGNLAFGAESGSRVEIHPDDAVPRGIQDGDLVRLYNARGSCRLTAAVGETVARGVVCAEAVRWNKRSPGGRNVNTLVSTRLTDMGAGPTFYNTLVEVERAGD